MPSVLIDSTKVLPQLTIIYGCGPSMTGQQFASEMLVRGLRERGWRVQTIKTPLLDRMGHYNSKQQLQQKLKLSLQLLRAWLKAFLLNFQSDLMLVNLGQTRFAMIRDGFPLLVRQALRRDQRAVISLHGNLFMTWDIQGKDAKLFQWIAKAAHCITVLGPNQKKRLLELGIKAETGIQVDNTCLLPAITQNQCRKKQTLHANEPLNVLYLSNLIVSKGYPEFVEAISTLASKSRLAIDVTLCGQIVVMNSDTRFAGHEQARSWVETQMAQVNQSSQVRVQWINGADGEAKEKLFREAHIFVLPSRYKVEAQPIAIIEALASGCAVITSKAGEIPAMVDSETAIMLDDVSSDTIAEAITSLSRNPDQRQILAQNGLELFNKRFTYKTYIDSWENLLLNISDSESVLTERD